MGTPFGRQLRQDAVNYTAGLVYIEFSAQLAGTGTPTALRGDEGVLSFVYAGSTGTYTLTMRDAGLREEVTAYVDIQDTGGDGRYASISAPSAEPSTSATTYTIKTFNAGGTPTNYTGPRIKVTLCWKKTGVGRGVSGN